MSDLKTMFDGMKERSREALAALGIEADMLRSVLTGTPAGFVVEHETDCPTYIGSITDGWWFARWSGRTDAIIVNVVKDRAGETRVEMVGIGSREIIETEVADGLRFLRKVEFPECI